MSKSRIASVLAAIVLGLGFASQAGSLSADEMQIARAPWWWYPRQDIGHLAGDSAAVIIGSVRSGRAYLTGDKDYPVVTQYQIRIEQVLKGERLHRNQFIRLNWIGGRVSLRDGSYYRSRVPFAGSLLPGRSHLLFLTDEIRLPLQAPTAQFEVLSGPESAFEILVDEAGTSRLGLVGVARFRADFTRSLEGRPLGDILEKVLAGPEP